MTVLGIIGMCLRLISAKNPLYENSRGCLNTNKTYIVNVHTHIQNEVRDAIVSLASKLNSSSVIDEIQGVAGEKAAITATKSYLGTVFEELNKDLEDFNIQINLVFENQEIDQISANGAFDPSCELASPVKERTVNSFSTLMSKLNNSIGIHLFLYGCIFRNPKFDLIHVVHNSNCGRVIGLMWDGSVNTKTLIKSGIMEGLMGVKDVYANGFLKVSDKNKLCGFAEKCIGFTSSPLGWIEDGKRSIKYTVDESSEHHSYLRNA